MRSQNEPQDHHPTHRQTRGDGQPARLPLSPVPTGQALLAGDPWDMIRLLEAALAEDDTRLDAPMILAQLVPVLQQQGAYIRCLYYMRRLLDLNPQEARLHEQLAVLLLKMDDLDGAVESYQSAMVFGQTPVQIAALAKTLSLLLYEKRQDMAGAVRCLRAALDLDPDNPELLSTLGDMHFEQGEYRAALATYQTLLDFEPQNADLHTYLGYLYWQLDENRKAVDAYEYSLTLRPDNPIALNNLGVIHLDSFGDARAAHPHFARACQLKTHYAMAQFNRGRSLEQLGRVSEARLAYQLAHRLNEVAEELPSEEILNRLFQLKQVS